MNDETVNITVEDAPSPWSLINDYSKTLVTLASALLALSVTFSSRLTGARPSGFQLAVLVASWVLLLSVIVLGVAAALYLAEFLKHKKKDDGNRCILSANLSFILLPLAALALLCVGALQVFGDRSTWDAAAVVEKARESAAGISQLKDADWQFGSMKLDGKRNAYTVILRDATSSQEFRVVIDVVDKRILESTTLGP